MKTGTATNTCTYTFTAAFFTTAPIWKQRERSSTWMGRQNTVYTYNGLLLSHVREQSADASYSSDETTLLTNELHGLSRAPAPRANSLTHFSPKTCRQWKSERLLLGKRERSRNICAETTLPDTILATPRMTTGRNLLVLTSQTENKQCSNDFTDDMIRI
jgi:hypothetical protein